MKWVRDVKCFKNPFFLIGFSFLFFLIMISIINHFVFGAKILGARPDRLLNLPLKPSFIHPLGTDTFGNDMLHIIIFGAKYTLLTGLSVTILRALLGIGLGIALSYSKVIKKQMIDFGEAFHFMPGTLITFFILFSVVSMTVNGFEYGLFTTVAFQILIMTFVALPSIIVVVCKEADLIKETDYYQAAQLLGAGKLHLVKNHILPSLKYNLFILTGQQFINALVIMVHLGVLNVFLGGTFIDFSPLHAPPHSISFEWSGLIGENLELLMIYPWIPFAPILFFALSILAIQFMIIGVTRVKQE